MYDVIGWWYCFQIIPADLCFVFVGDGEKREYEAEGRNYPRGDWIQGE
jgi:hypothetical protein